jgi:outer membrane protease
MATVPITLQSKGCEMDDYDWLAQQSEANRVHFSAVIDRMLGSLRSGHR